MLQQTTNIMVGVVYEDDLQNQLGRYHLWEGKTYQFVKFASGTQVAFPGHALSVSNAAVAIPCVNKINAINVTTVDARSADKYALVIVEDSVGSYVNVYSAATGSANWDNKPLVRHDSASSTGAIVAGDTRGLVQDGTLSLSTSVFQTAWLAGATDLSTVSAAFLTAMNSWASDINNTTQRISDSWLKANGNLTCSTGIQGNSIANALAMVSAGDTVVTATAAPISAYMQKGSVLTYYGNNAVVTAIDTASGGVTAGLASGFPATGGLTATGSGFSATGGALTGFYLGAMQVKAVFK
jgi:hypothetical protein